MDPTLPMDITPNVGGRSPDLSPDSPYASSLPLSTIISALKAGGQGAVGAAQQGAQGGQQPTQAPAQPANNAPNYNQFRAEHGRWPWSHAASAWWEFTIILVVGIYVR